VTWSHAALGELCEIVSGATPKTDEPSYWGGDILWTTPKDLSDLETPYLDRPPRTITADGLKSCAANLLPVNSVLLSSRAPIGLVAINRQPVATNQGFKSLVPDRRLLDSKFLYHWLKANTSYLQSLGNGATFKEISKAVVERVEIPLPPLDEQRRIAAILDKADALRHKRKSMLELIDELSTGLFRKTFVQGDEGRWPSTTVSEVALNTRTGPFGSQLLHSEFVDDGIAVLGIDNAVENEFRWTKRRFISEKKYIELKRYTVLPGDVIITIMGTCGRCAVVPENVPAAINTKHLCCITLDRDKCLPEFLKAVFLQHPVVLKQLGVQAKGAVMPGLNMGIIKSLSFPLPPLDVQAAFAQTLSALEDVRSQLRKASSEFEMLFSSLQHRAFSGQL
jgi:type I restriction enzyme, S subunit